MKAMAWQPLPPGSKDEGAGERKMFSGDKKEFQFMGKGI